MANSQRVLVIEGLSETAQVLKAVLEPQGVTVDRIRAHQSNLLSAGTRPQLMIVHHDAHDTRDTTTSVADQTGTIPAQPGAGTGNRLTSRTRTVQTSWHDVPTVVIGSGHRPQTGVTVNASRHYLEKPFQYSDLIQTIETLLATHDATGHSIDANDGDANDGDAPGAAVGTSRSAA